MEDPQPGPAQTPAGWWATHRQQVGVAIFCLYVALLLLGTIGELFDVEWILNLPLWSP
jgi:hypothetical protein